MAQVCQLKFVPSLSQFVAPVCPSLPAMTLSVGAGVSISDVVLDSLHDAIESRGQGIVMTVLSSLARARVVRTEDANHGLFVKIFYSSTEASSPCTKRKTGQSLASTSPTSTSYSPISRERLLQRRSIPDLPGPQQMVSVKNTFVDFHSDSDGSNGVASAPGELLQCKTVDDIQLGIPPGLVVKDSFFYGDISLDAGVQTCVPPKASRATVSVQIQALPKPRACRVNGRACQTDCSYIAAAFASVATNTDSPAILEEPAQVALLQEEIAKLLAVAQGKDRQIDQLKTTCTALSAIEQKVAALSKAK